MQINPIPTVQPGEAPREFGDPMIKRLQGLKTIRMNTNASHNKDPGAPPPEQPIEKLSISDVSEEKAEAVATEPLNPQAAELARRRRSLQVKERELLEKEKAIQSEAQKATQMLARLKESPLEVLTEAGVTYDQLTESILAGQGNSEISALKAELKALQKGVDEKFTEKDKQSEQQVLAEMQREATLIASQGTDFELVRETKSIPDVVRLIEQNYRKTGEVLDVREALKLVEDELFAEAQRLMGLEKLKAQSMPAAQQPQGMRTLSNKHTASVPMSVRDRAIARFYGTLK